MPPLIQMTRYCNSKNCICFSTSKIIKLIVLKAINFNPWLNYVKLWLSPLPTYMINSPVDQISASTVSFVHIYRKLIKITDIRSWSIKPDWFWFIFNLFLLSSFPFKFLSIRYPFWELFLSWRACMETFHLFLQIFFAKYFFVTVVESYISMINFVRRGLLVTLLRR